MADTVSKDVRSRTMRAIRSKRTGPELLLRLALARNALRGWKLNDSRFPGTPDVVFPRRRLAVFVDGCFWHGCPSCYRGPKSNTKYWRGKIRFNRARDAKDCRSLTRLGWHVLRIWEHRVRARPADCVDLIRKQLGMMIRAM